MSKPFTGSRLASLREKRVSQQPASQQIATVKPSLQMPEQQTIDYQPSSSNQANRTGTRFFKGKIQRQSGLEPNADNSSNKETNSISSKQNISEKKIMISSQKQENNSGGLRLVLNDQPDFQSKKVSQIKSSQTSQQPAQKRLLIQKKQSISEQAPKVQETRKLESKKSIKAQEQSTSSRKDITMEKKITPAVTTAIKEQDIEESKDFGVNENQLIECPEGCGRKFNRKALEKHAKACKLVFMSKRKQFNSEAKRFTSQEQEKKAAQKGKTKDMGKTGDNWKAASEEFRSALKAVKKDQTKQEEQQGQLKVISCEFCEKPFAQALIMSHQQNCQKRKEKQQKDKKRTTLNKKA